MANTPADGCPLAQGSPCPSAPPDRIVCPRCGRQLAHLAWDIRTGVARVETDRHATIEGTHFCPDAVPLSSRFEVYGGEGDQVDPLPPLTATAR